MYIHGFITALVGEPEAPKLLCSVVRKRDGADLAVEPLEGDKSFVADLHLDRAQETKETLKRVLTTVQEVIDLQNQDEEHSHKQVQVIVGSDGRHDYSKLMPRLETALTEAVKEIFDLASAQDLFGQLFLHKGKYTELIPLADGREVACDEQRFNEFIERVNLKSGELNEHLEVFKSDLPQYLSSICFIAEELGKKLAGAHPDNPEQRFLFNLSPFKRFTNNIEPKSKLNLYDFVSWHPDIKAALKRGYAKIRGPMNLVVKGINEDSSPPFFDVIACYIQDAFDDIEYDPSTIAADSQQFFTAQYLKCLEAILEPDD